MIAPPAGVPRLDDRRRDVVGIHLSFRGTAPDVYPPTSHADRCEAVALQEVLDGPKVRIRGDVRDVYPIGPRGGIRFAYNAVSVAADGLKIPAEPNSRRRLSHRATFVYLLAPLPPTRTERFIALEA